MTRPALETAAVAIIYGFIASSFEFHLPVVKPFPFPFPFPFRLSFLFF